MKTQLTDEQMRIAIAEACGWAWVPNPVTNIGGYWERGAQGCEGYERGDWGSRELAVGLPDYLNSLDAMHEAEKAIPRHLWTEYTMQLRKVIQRECDTEEHYILGCERSQLIADFWFYHATARQRAEAFIAVTQPHPATQEETKP